MSRFWVGGAVSGSPEGEEEESAREVEEEEASVAADEAMTRGDAGAGASGRVSDWARLLLLMRPRDRTSRARR
jgi:hypothetical protein